MPRRALVEEQSRGHAPTWPDRLPGHVGSPLCSRVVSDSFPRLHL